MKRYFIFLLLLVLVCTVVYSQKRTFLRIYSITGSKFQKGYLAGTTDSSINIYKHGNTLEVPASGIGFIKTKRSSGHTILLTELAIAIPIALLGVAVGAANEVTIAGVGLFGFAVGSLIAVPAGALIAGSKESITFTIEGNLANWRLQRKKINLLPMHK